MLVVVDALNDGHFLHALPAPSGTCQHCGRNNVEYVELTTDITVREPQQSNSLCL